MSVATVDCLTFSSQDSVPLSAKTWFSKAIVANCWKSLYTFLKKNIKGTVFVHCQGGHGRAGTACSILSYLAGVIIKDSNPITFVRDAYCNRAVESDEQIWYVEAITGVDCSKIDTPPYKPLQPLGTQYTKDSGYTYSPTKNIGQRAEEWELDDVEEDDRPFWSPTLQGYVDGEGLYLGSKWDEACKMIKARREKENGTRTAIE